MIPQEKAIDLIMKFLPNASHPIEDSDTDWYNATQCALIAVDERIDVLNQLMSDLYDTRDNVALLDRYIQEENELKQEIEKL